LFIIKIQAALEEPRRSALSGRERSARGQREQPQVYAIHWLVYS